MTPDEIHPLFPFAEDDVSWKEREAVRWISVTRQDPRSGQYVHAPRMWSADDLEDLSQIADCYGGGFYELHGRGGGRSGRAHIVDRRFYRIAGAPKPLGALESVDDAAPDGAPASPQPVPPVQPTFVASGGNFAEQMVLAMMQMMAQKESAQTQLLVAMLGRNDQNAQQYVQAMQQLHDRHAQSQAQIFATILQAQQNGSESRDPSEMLMRGIELANEMRAGIADGAATAESEQSDVAALVEGLKVVTQLTGPGGAPSPAHAPTGTSLPLTAPMATPTSAQGGPPANGTPSPAPPVAAASELRNVRR